MNIKEEYFAQVFDLLNQSKIEYICVAPACGDAANSIPVGQYIEILIRPEDKEAVYQLFYEHDYLLPLNPFGRSAGWTFAYQLPENQYWKVPRTEQDVYVLVNFKLCCKSLMPKVWIPLDKSVNENVWEDKVWDEEQHLWCLDEKTQLIMFIVQAVFNEKKFSNQVKAYLAAHKALLQQADVRYKLERIFFKYTDRLYEKVSAGEFDQLPQDHVTFQQY